DGNRLKKTLQRGVETSAFDHSRARNRHDELSLFVQQKEGRGEIRAKTARDLVPGVIKDREGKKFRVRPDILPNVGLGILEPDRDGLERFSLHSFLKVVDLRELFLTGSAPGGPEDDQGDLPGKRLLGKLFPAQRIQFKGRDFRPARADIRSVQKEKTYEQKK